MIGPIIKYSVHHRWLVIMFTTFIAGLGIYALQRLPIDAVPDITNKQVTINSVVPSLSPVEVEKQVTFSIETALAGIPGLVSTRSLSRNGFSQVTAIFKDDVEIYFARQQINERLAEIRSRLPPGSDPKLGPITTGLGEVYTWTLEFSHPGGVGLQIKPGQIGWQPDGTYMTPEGERLATIKEQITYLRTVQDWIVRPQLKGVPGLADLDILGGYERQYAVQPDPDKLMAFGFSLHDLAEALERSIVSTGAGYVERNGESFLLRADDRAVGIADIGATVVRSSSGRMLRVRDVAKVQIGTELRGGAALKNGREVVIGTALMRIGENSRIVALAVGAKLKDINRSLPSDIVALPALDRTKLVDATIETVKSNLGEGAVLVIVVLFLLLGNVRAALVTAATIPFAMLFVAIGMVQGKVSGNLMSLGAIDFGLIVDGAVIIVENCLSRLAKRTTGLGRVLTLPERLTEVTEATKEMIKPSVYGQGIIITSYLPLLALSGIEGKMFQPMALTVILALVSAFILSVTFIPAVIGLVITKPFLEHDNAAIRRCKKIYEPLLRLALKQRLPVVLLAAIACVGAFFLFQTLGEEFIPTLEEHDLAIETMRIPSTGIDQAVGMQSLLEKAIMRIPEVTMVFSKTGTAEASLDPMPPSSSDTYVIFKPRSEWSSKTASREDVLNRVQEALAGTIGSKFEISQPIQMRFGELLAGVRGDVAIKVYGDDFPALQKSAGRIASLLRKIKGSTHPKIEQTAGFPTMIVRANRMAAARFGISAGDIQETLAIAMGGREVGSVYEGDRHFPIVVRLADTLRNDHRSLLRLPVFGIGEPGQDDSLRKAFVPLSAVASVETTEGINQISRENGKRRVVVQTNVRNRDLGSFVKEAQEVMNSGLKLPPGQWIEWGGQFENLMAARDRLQIVVPVCFLVILLMLYSAYGSVKLALSVFSGVPLALSGGVAALWLRGIPFSVSAAVGFIALSGVAVLNGLVLVSAINQLRTNADAGSLDDMIVQGALARLRPVLMTASVASLGFLPMALAVGTGAEVQKPIATVVIGGLVTSTFLTLFVLPSLYMIVMGKRSSVSMVGGG